MAPQPPARRLDSRGLPLDPLRIVVVDDHPIILRGLVELLNDQPDFAVCGEAATSAAATAVIAAQHPDVAIVDLSLGDESGLDLVAALTTAHPGLRVLVLSGHDERVYADRALKAGALGYIMKGQVAAELLRAVRLVASGKSYVRSETAERMLSTLGTSRPDGPTTSSPDRLSDRERHVLTLVGRGLATREIAQQLQLSVKTIESHYAHIKEKLGIRNARELMSVAVNWVEQR